jgi:phage baseplate assembly protein W
MNMNININFPFHFDSFGRTARPEEEEHIRDMIKQVLFTSPGERVNRPTFGSGLMQLVFAPNNEELATSTRFMVQGALQQWLGDLIQVEEVIVENNDNILNVAVNYIVLKTREHREAKFSRAI